MKAVPVGLIINNNIIIIFTIITTSKMDVLIKNHGMVLYKTSAIVEYAITYLCDMMH